MPLVMICGHPCAGKTAVAERVKNAIIEKMKVTPRVVSLESVEYTPQKAFRTPATTRSSHALLRNEVLKLMAEKHVVILDFYTYIKGFRYELYCGAKELATPSCVIWVDTPIRVCRERNMLCGDGEKQRYSSELLDDIASRFEAPLPNTKWDRPLFTCWGGFEIPDYSDICTAEKIGLTQQHLTLDISRVLTELTSTKRIRQPRSTRTEVIIPVAYEMALEQYTKNMVEDIQVKLSSGAFFPGDTVSGPRYHFELKRPLVSSDLYAMRQRFIAFEKTHEMPPTITIDKLCQSFAEFIQSQS